MCPKYKVECGGPLLLPARLLSCIMEIPTKLALVH